MTSIIAFPGFNLNDLPGMLRALADQIEGGEYGEARGLAYAFVTEDEDVYANCIGRIGALEACGLLAVAQNMMMPEIGADE